GVKRATALPTLALTLDGGGRKRVGLPLSRKLRRRAVAAARKGTVRLTVNAVATDAGGNVSRTSKTVRLRLGR
nr:hypothetical protein [Actinomycetota bacterium]